MVSDNHLKDISMSEIKHHHLQKWMWWNKGECVVEVLHTGHFPTTAIVRLPNDKESEIDVDELRNEGGTL
jgi:hypothetical protein